MTTVNEIRLCGASNWRLPTREELRTLVDYARTQGPVIETRVFPNTMPQFHWSGSEDASDRRSAWGVGFAFGFDYAYPKDSIGHLRLVHGPSHRGEQRPASCGAAEIAFTTHPRFIPDSTGHVVDRVTGLTWQRCSLGQEWADSECRGKPLRVSYANAQRSAEGSVWRIPTLSELDSLVELRCHTPAINQTLFPNTPKSDYWTSTPLARTPQLHWFVSFIYGDSYVTSRDSEAFVRFVRDP
jgi:hypothetical protein